MQSTKNICAVMFLSEAQMVDTSRLKMEICILKLMDSQNTIKFYETRADQHDVYLAKEFCCGGEPVDKIIGDGHVTEFQTAIVVQQIVCAIIYKHESGVCHNNLKPDHFLCQTKEAVKKITLEVAVELSRTFRQGRILTTKANSRTVLRRRSLR